MCEPRATIATHHILYDPPRVFLIFNNRLIHLRGRWRFVRISPAGAASQPESARHDGRCTAVRARGDLEQPTGDVGIGAVHGKGNLLAKRLPESLVAYRPPRCGIFDVQAAPLQCHATTQQSTHRLALRFTGCESWPAHRRDAAWFIGICVAMNDIGSTSFP